MTINNNTQRAVYTGTGTSGPFTFNFKILSTDQLKVIKRLIASPYTETELVLTTDYTVSITGPEAGTVTTVAVVSSSYELIILRNMEFTQESAFRSQGQQNASSWENAFDTAKMDALQLKRGVDGSIRIPDSEDPADYSLTLPPAGDRPNTIPYFDANGDLTSDTAAQVLTTGFSEAAVPYVNSSTLLDEDAELTWTAADSALNVASGRFKLRPWADVTHPTYGAVGDGTTNDLAAVQAAMAAGKTVYFPPGKTYKLSGKLTWLDADQKLVVPHGAKINFGTYNGVCFEGPAGLTGIRQWRIEGGGQIVGDASASALSQKFCQFNDTNGRGWLTVKGMSIGGYDADPSKQFRTLVDIAAYDSAGISLLTVKFEDCDIPAPYVAAVDSGITKYSDANSPKLVTTSGAAGAFAGAAYVNFIRCRLGDYTGANPHRWYMQADIDFGLNQSDIFLGSDSKWNGTDWCGSYIKTSESATNTTGIYTTYGAYWTKHVGIVNCFLNEGSGGYGSTIVWDNGVTIQGFVGEEVSGSSFLGVALKCSAARSVVRGCVFDGQAVGGGGAGLQATLVEITGDNSIVSDCLFQKAGSNLVHLNGPSRCVVSDNIFVPVASEKTIRETTGNSSAISGNNGTGRGGGLALNGAATISFESGKNLA